LNVPSAVKVDAIAALGAAPDDMRFAKTGRHPGARRRGGRRSAKTIRLLTL
jgi:hypothetical protein